MPPVVVTSANQVELNTILIHLLEEFLGSKLIASPVDMDHNWDISVTIG